MGRRVIVGDKQFYENILTKMLDPAHRKVRINAVNEFFKWQHNEDRDYILGPLNVQVIEGRNKVILDLEQLNETQKIIKELFAPGNEKTADNKIHIRGEAEFNDFLQVVNGHLIPFFVQKRFSQPSNYSPNDRLWHEFIAPELLLEQLAKRESESSEDHAARREKAIVLLGNLMLQADLHDDLWQEVKKLKEAKGKVTSSLQLQQISKKLDELREVLSPSANASYLCQPYFHHNAIPILKSLQSKPVREWLRRQFVTSEGVTHNEIPSEQRLTQRWSRQQTFRQFGQTLKGIEDKVKGSTSQYVEFLTDVTCHQNDVFVLTAEEFLASLGTAIESNPAPDIKALVDNKTLSIQLSEENSDAKSAQQPKATFTYRQKGCVYTLQQEVLEEAKAEEDLQKKVWTRLTLSSQSPQDAQATADHFASRIRTQILLVMGLNLTAATDEQKSQQQACLQEHRLTITRLPKDMTEKMFTEALERAGFAKANITFRLNSSAAEKKNSVDGNPDSAARSLKVGAK